MRDVNVRVWAFLFLTISVIAALFGFFLIVGVMAAIARIFFWVFAILFAALWLRHARRRLRR